MSQKNTMFSFRNFCKISTLLFVTISLGACSSSGGGGGCDTVANADGPAFLKVVNKLGGGVEWYLPDYAFAADMHPGECTIMGVSSRQYTLELRQCTITENGCTNLGPVKYIVFSVADGETYSLTVDANTF